jgi:hypothetical protein
MNDASRPWWSLRGAARHRRVPERAVYAAARSGELVIYRFDSRPRVRMSDFDAWVERHRRDPSSADDGERR